MALSAAGLHAIAEELRDIHTLQDSYARLDAHYRESRVRSGAKPNKTYDGFDHFDFEALYKAVADRLAGAETGQVGKLRVMVTLDGRMAFFDSTVPHWGDLRAALAVVQCPDILDVGKDIQKWLGTVQRSGDTMSHVCGLVAIAFQDDGPAS
jgi:hypothetical protein